MEETIEKQQRPDQTNRSFFYLFVCYRESVKVGTSLSSFPFAVKLSLSRSLPPPFSLANTHDIPSYRHTLHPTYMDAIIWRQHHYKWFALGIGTGVRFQLKKFAWIVIPLCRPTPKQEKKNRIRTRIHSNAIRNRVLDLDVSLCSMLVFKNMCDRACEIRCASGLWEMSDALHFAWFYIWKHLNYEYVMHSDGINELLRVSSNRWRRPARKKRISKQPHNTFPPCSSVVRVHLMFCDNKMHFTNETMKKTLCVCTFRVHFTEMRYGRIL